MADLPKRVWSGKKQVYSWKKPVWVKDWKLWVYDPNFEEVNNWQYYSPNRWGNLSSDAELQIYDDKDSLNPTDIGTFEDWLESTYQFVDYDSTVLKSWKVKDWETPVAPTDPTREHYTFTGWNPTVWPINKNTTYSAVYAIDTFTVNIWVNNPDYGDVSMSSLWSVPYGTAISASDNVLTIGETTITATAETWYQFSSWGALPATVTENLTITATFEAITISYADWSDWTQLRNKIRDQLPEEVDVMMMSGAKKVQTIGQTSTDIGWLWGWEWFGDWEVFVAVLSNANVDVLWIAVKTEQELWWYEELQTLRDAFMSPDDEMTDAIWNQVMWWFITTLTVTTSWWETTISDGSQSIIIDTTSHAMRYGADYYDWTDNTATEYALCNTNWWLVDGTYQYETSDQETTDWNNLVASIKAKGIVNATITHDVANWEITMANGQWSMTIMDKNIGATEYLWQTPNNDALAYWDYYCWGWKTPFVTLPTNPNEDDWQQVQTIAPAGYHIPTINELRALVNMFTAVRPNAHSGDDFKDTFKMPFAGQRGSWDAVVHGQGNNGEYWSSTPYNSDEAYYLQLDSSIIVTQNHTYRSFGDPVRCFKDLAN